jgi:O-antigen ligase
MTTLRHRTVTRYSLIWLIVLSVMGLALLLGYKASTNWLFLLLAGIGTVAVLFQPILGLLAIPVTALLINQQIGTGTEVALNVVSLLVPALLVVWFLDMVRRKEISLVPSATYLPLILFLLASLLSLLVGITTWDPSIPRSNGFILVQLAQWGIFVFSAGAFFLSANLIKDEKGLRLLTWTLLLIAGLVAIIRFLPGFGVVVDRIITIAFIRAPLWTLITGLAGGQLLYNRKLTPAWRLFLIILLVYAIYFSFFVNRESSSTWVGVGSALAVLLWLRYPRLRWFVVLLIVAMTAAGILFPVIWNFAGGGTAWFYTGGSRLALVERVIEVTLRNPITGLGPAAYRSYANATPLVYEHIFWAEPRVSSHNNYVDLFAHGGILGLILFGWFCWEIYRIGLRLHRRFNKGFSAGYVNAMLAVGFTSLILMLLADWILPFVYNIGFPGFQASVLIWLFLGGLVALDQFQPDEKDPDSL